jgi:hypothetical protein
MTELERLKRGLHRMVAAWKNQGMDEQADCVTQVMENAEKEMHPLGQVIWDMFTYRPLESIEVINPKRRENHRKEEQL